MPSSLAKEMAAQAWTKKETEKLVFNEKLAEAFAEILDGVLLAPHLGCATTGDLIDEIRARCEVNGTIGYRTIDDK